MVPASTLVTLKRVYGPETVTRNNLFNAVTINGTPKPGYSTGDAIKAIEETAKQVLPRGYHYEWTGMTREEISTGNQTAFIFLLSVIFVYFLLAAQYESYILPLAVILSVPTGIFGVFLFTSLTGIEVNIYVQVGLIMLVGLLAKNAILIVEYAVQRRKAGMGLIASALEASQLRLRPILMTSLAFIVGMLPLVWTHGASALGNHSIGRCCPTGTPDEPWPSLLTSPRREPSPISRVRGARLVRAALPRRLCPRCCRRGLRASWGR